MKTIYINGKFLCQSMTGVQRYAYEIIAALDKLIEKNSVGQLYKFVLLVPNINSPINSNYHNIKIIKPKFRVSGFFWEQFWLPLFTKNHILLNLAGSSPMFKFNQFCTFHDAAVFENSFTYKWHFVWWYKLLFKFQSTRCLKIFTVSNFSKERLSFFLRVPKGRIAVISNSSDHMKLIKSDDSILNRLGIKNKKYFFAIASASPSKNINELINAFNLLDHGPNFYLVLAGGAGSIFSSYLQSTSMYANVINAGRISDNELKSLYSSALAFIFPSLYEGFGIPPLEAMACKCPVIASNLPVIKEVCADAAIYIDPNSINSMIDALNKVISNDILLSEIIDRGTSRANMYSWENSARALLNHIDI